MKRDHILLYLYFGWRAGKRTGLPLYTSEHINAASTIPVATSKTECCFKNMVEATMLSARSAEPRRTGRLDLKLSQWHTAAWMAIELYTWMLGNRFVAVSAE